MKASVPISLLMSLVVLSVSRGGEKDSTRTRDVIYGRKDGLALTLDVFHPSVKPNRAAVVLVASGAFKSAASDIQPVFTAELVKRGYVCFVVVHGSQPRYTVPEIREDVNRAVRFIRYHAMKYDVDGDRIGIGGLSSGGLLALLQSTAPLDSHGEARDPVNRVPSNVQAVAAFFPPTDYLNYGTLGKTFLTVADHGVPFRAPHDFREFDSKEGVYRAITQREKLAAIYKSISPIYHVSPKTAPTLLIHGDKDDLVPFQQSESYFEKLKQAAVVSKLERRPGAGHGWFTILSDMSVVANWFDEHLKAK